MENQTKTNFQLNNLSLGDKIILGSGIVALISLFLPWQELGMLGTLIGISDYAWLPFILGWGLPVFTIFKPLKIKIVFSLCGNLAAFLWSIIYILFSGVENPFTDEVIKTSTWGVYIFCLATLALGGGIVLKNKVKNVAGLVDIIKADIQSFKK